MSDVVIEEKSNGSMDLGCSSWEPEQANYTADEFVNLVKATTSSLGTPAIYRQDLTKKKQIGGEKYHV